MQSNSYLIVFTQHICCNLSLLDALNSERLNSIKEKLLIESRLLKLVEITCVEKAEPKRSSFFNYKFCRHSSAESSSSTDSRTTSSGKCSTASKGTTTADWSANTGTTCVSLALFT